MSSALKQIPNAIFRDKKLHIAALPLGIPQPERMIGIVYRRSSANDPVNRKYFGHLRANMQNLSRVVAKRDAAIAWQVGPFMGRF
jgi:hypothetical protein